MIIEPLAGDEHGVLLLLLAAGVYTVYTDRTIDTTMQ